MRVNSTTIKPSVRLSVLLAGMLSPGLAGSAHAADLAEGHILVGYQQSGL